MGGWVEEGGGVAVSCLIRGESGEQARPNFMTWAGGAYGGAETSAAQANRLFEIAMQVPHSGQA